MKLAFERWGKGPRTLVALHGFTGCRGSFRHLEPLLGERLDVVAVDLPGHGDSALPASLGESGWSETLDALVTVLNRLDVPVADVYGYSQGARVALGLALYAADRVRSLVLESGSAGLADSAERDTRRKQDEDLAHLIERDGTEAFVANWEALPLFATQRALAPELQQAQRQRRLAQAAPGLSGALLSLGVGVQPNYWEALPTLKQPVLLVAGAEDAKFSVLANQMAGRLPNAQVKLIPGAGHAVHLENPAALSRALLEFLSAKGTR